MKNKAAQALGRQGKGVPRRFSNAEIARRKQRLVQARAKRWPAPNMKTQDHSSTVKSYRATVHIRGVSTMFLYGKKLAALKTKATKWLTLNPPGSLNTWPEKFIIWEHVVTGAEAEWVVVETVLFESIPERDQEWFVRRQCQA